MAKVRKFVAYRRIERPYTRRSKYRRKNFVRAAPHSKIVRYVMGDKKREFQYLVKLVSKTDLQIRHNALEAARVSANRVLEKALGREGFLLRIRVYPHHMLRENALASGAGADRLSTGMKMSFGKVVGIAARVFKGDVVLFIGVSEKNLPVARTAMERVRMKLPNSYNVVIEKNPLYVE